MVQPNPWNTRPLRSRSRVTSDRLRAQFRSEVPLPVPSPVRSDMNPSLLNLTITLLEAYRTFIELCVTHLTQYCELHHEDEESTIYTPSSTTAVATTRPNTLATNPPTNQCFCCHNNRYDQNTLACYYHLNRQERRSRNLPPALGFGTS